MKSPAVSKHNIKGGAPWPPASSRLDGIAAATWPAASTDRFHLHHLWLPLVGFATVLALLALLQGDAWWADRLYAWQGGHWALRNAYLTQTLIHLGGRDLSTAAWLAVALAWLVAWRRPALARLRWPLAYLALATLLATAAVAWLKSWSNMDCPWDLLRYGGDRPYVGLLALRPVGLSRGVCFPAGHASGGYAWMSLYFFALTLRPRLRYWGLAVGVGAGLLFGFSQQLRGAHFLSHDVWTAALCWMTVLGVYLLFRRHLPLAPRA
ncbi:phosphatase PAP2 family protein [Lysobacter silvisoli]|uniref:PAP2 family protein n=1 Tax=Lysobacter silvisoli TaxID=2293254 RepID=A0A371K0X3_9GAMM|nr:phosphatase PAP2 family protein [Lysobacter silvisoli]RDZ27544.1 PAP2 family protein [Lysobacter silvisoli]